jgi:hypothetical protein
MNATYEVANISERLMKVQTSPGVTKNATVWEVQLVIVPDGQAPDKAQVLSGNLTVRLAAAPPYHTGDKLTSAVPDHH